MNIQKVKVYPNLLTEIKQHLKIASGDTTYDVELSAITQTAIDQLSNDIQFDVVSTESTLTDYCFNGQYYNIDQPNVTIWGITGTSSTGVVTIIPATAITEYNHTQYTRIKLPTSYSFESLVIHYGSGSATIPSSLLHAIKIMVQILFDGTADNEAEIKAYQRLIRPYRTMLN